ncbi:MAG TPA: polysaccharide pyruvyl transferase family protein [Burkholderiales bacterium]|nr:polysaccharide pyruvyl transferase family protein [Burkholderiales bacterium]
MPAAAGAAPEALVAAAGHATLMKSLARSHAVIAELVGGRGFHYVDIPVHGNIGDLLIMQGTLEFFRRNDLKPRLIAPVFAYSPQWLQPGEAIVFHGGGNFGDLYWQYGNQPMREKAVAMLPRNRIIVLPQTLHFSSERERRRSAGIFRSHPDVHICVRDRQSYRLAQDFSDHVYLLPDMAHQLYPMAVPGAADGRGTLVISRVDDEKTAGGRVEGPSTDWPQLVGEREKKIDAFRRGMRALYRAGMGCPTGMLQARLWIAYAERLTAEAAGLFSAHSHIVTDRLHGHILACLLDLPSTVMDNSYGKNSSYVETWTGASGLVRLRRG